MESLIRETAALISVMKTLSRDVNKALQGAITVL